MTHSERKKKTKTHSIIGQDINLQTKKQRVKNAELLHQQKETLTKYKNSKESNSNNLVTIYIQHLNLCGNATHDSSQVKLRAK